MAETAVSNPPSKATVKLSEIKIDGGLYPRVKGHDPELVQHYARDMSEIEAAGKYISINADGVLIDGKHRYLAYKKLRDSNMDAEVSVYRYDDIVSPVETFRLACALQELGRSLSNDDRVDSAKKLYSLGESSQAEIAKALHVQQSTVSKWLSRTLKDEKVRKKDAAFGLWSACHTQNEIADAVGVPIGTVPTWEMEFLEICRENKSRNSADFTPPIYNVWKKQSKSNNVDHFGNSEPQWLDNLLYLYTDPGEVVVDPFAGSGSTIDVCKKRGRRHFVSDRKPIVEREEEIREHCLSDGLPRVPRWKDVKLVYLDPPYWMQAAGEYSDDMEDLANMTLDEFNKQLSGIVKAFAGKLKHDEKRYIALIIQPTQWKAPNRQYTDHVGDMLRLVQLPVNMRYSVPYESQQCNAQMVEWAKNNKTCLVLTREIIVWEVN